MSEEFGAELAAIEATAVSYLTAFHREDVRAVIATYARMVKLFKRVETQRI